MERRKVTVLGLFWRHFLWLPLIPAAISLVFLSMAAARFANADLLARHGITVTGQVIDREIFQRRNPDGPDTRNYHVIYSFRTLAGQEGRGRAAVSLARYNSLPIGSPLQVTYAEVDPSVSTLNPGARQYSGWGLGGFGLLAALGAVVLGWFLLGLKRSALRAAREGEVREAQVSALMPGSLRVRGEQYYQMEWRDAAGATGQSRNHSLSKLPERGSLIVVYVDPITGKGWWENDL
jgi:hypothetical protein